MKVAMEGPRIRRVGGRRLERGLARPDYLDQPEVEAQECRFPARGELGVVGILEEPKGA